jgi:hypothetical protein
MGDPKRAAACILLLMLLQSSPPDVWQQLQQKLAAPVKLLLWDGSGWAELD